MSKVEGNNAHKGTEVWSGYRTKRGFMFDSTLPALPVPTKTNRKNNKKYDGSFSYGAALLLPPKSGGVEHFPLAHPPPQSSMVVLSPLMDTRGRRRQRRTPCPLQLPIISLARR